MAKMEEIKKLQLEEESDTLDELVRAKLDVVFQETQLLARTMPALKLEDATGVIVGAFNGFLGALALDTSSSREEFLKEMGEAYDEAVSDATEVVDEGDEDEEEEEGAVEAPPVS